MCVIGLGIRSRMYNSEHIWAYLSRSHSWAPQGSNAGQYNFLLITANNNLQSCWDATSVCVILKENSGEFLTPLSFSRGSPPVEGSKKTDENWLELARDLHWLPVLWNSYNANLWCGETVWTLCFCMESLTSDYPVDISTKPLLADSRTDAWRFLLPSTWGDPRENDHGVKKRRNSPLSISAQLFQEGCTAFVHRLSQTEVAFSNGPCYSDAMPSSHAFCLSLIGGHCSSMTFFSRLRA